MCHLSDCPVLLVYDALKARHSGWRFRVNICPTGSQADGELRDAPLQLIPLRLSGAHGLRFRGIYRGQGKNVVSLTGHVFTFARFRYFWRFLLRDRFRFRVLQCAQVFLFLFAFQFYLLLLRLRVFGVYRAGLEHRIRDILKSRQIGATFYFSREALLRALKTGHNQIFLSASKTQAYVFREYIIAFARLVDVDLTGDPIVLGNNGAKLIFLGTNSNTAQSHNGDLYVDEIFWIPNFQVLRKVASGMASQSHLRSTYFSTPSTLAHDAYPFWSGELFNRGRASAAERVEIDVSHNALAGGLLCADGQWRQIVTIEDALKGGCTLFDIEQLKRENSADDFKNLFMCEFVDDKASVFPFEELQRCMVDTLEEWEDYAPFAANPFGSRPVWIGYDPSHRGDSAGCVVLAPPVVAGGKFRILERHQWKGMDFATQAESIRKLTEKYNVEYIGIDATGLGVGVFQLVRSFYPAARDIRYTPEMKTAMVLKAKDVIRRGCLEYDVSATDITSSFMAIRKTMTSSGRSATYEASRSEEASHADLAWATMHALLNEPLTAGISTPLTSTILEFY